MIKFTSQREEEKKEKRKEEKRKEDTILGKIIGFVSQFLRMNRESMAEKKKSATLDSVVTTSVVQAGQDD
ncbi:MAG: hypothetical protein ACPGWR_32610 [Ardenticatenaceae bacterium]